MFSPLYYVDPEGRQKPINTSIKKDEAKVVNKTTLVDLQDKVKDGKPVAYCRCWKSKTFPYCDGSHAKWNEATKDNVRTPEACLTFDAYIVLRNSTFLFAAIHCLAIVLKSCLLSNRSGL